MFFHFNDIKNFTQILLKFKINYTSLLIKSYFIATYLYMQKEFNNYLYNE